MSWLPAIHIRIIQVETLKSRVSFQVIISPNEENLDHSKFTKEQYYCSCNTVRFKLTHYCLITVDDYCSTFWSLSPDRSTAGGGNNIEVPICVRH